MKHDRWIWIGLAVLTVLAAGLRFYRLDVLPPGLFGDETLVSLHARDAVSSGRYPIYFAQIDGGFHPGVVYLTMLARALTGNHPLAVRFGVAAVGALSIPVVFFALRAIYRLDLPEGESMAAALLGAFILCITFPYILITRIGFEVFLPAPAGALVFLFLALGLRTQRPRYYVLSGLALGVALYTYYSARLLPAAVVLALAWTGLIAGRPAWKRTAAHLALVTAASVVAFAPLGLYFLRNPAIFFTRAADTSAQTLGQGGGALLRLANSTLRTLAALSIDGFGDFIPRHNIPYQAVYDVFLSLLFWVGLVVLIRRPRSRTSALLLSWAGVMLLPVILTMEKNSPHFTRMMGAFPALAGIAAVGGLTFFEVLARRGRALGYGLLGFGLAFSLSLSTYHYFVRWANDPGLYDAFQIGDWRAANYALEQSGSSEVFLSPELLTNPAHAAFNLLLSGTPVRHFPGPACLTYLDRPARPVTYVVDALNDRQTFDRVHALFPGGREGPTIYHAVDPWPLYQIFEVPAGSPAVPPEHPARASFGDALQLVGYDLDRRALHPGDTLTLTLYWRALKPLDADYVIFVHLYPPGEEAGLPPAGSAPVAQVDGPPCGGLYPTSRWEANDVVVDMRSLSLPPDQAAADAVLGLGVYGWPSLERLPIAGTDAILPENRLRLATVTVMP
jgi:4-amino-4-deoxy-L-arabinose transferase-like glycosyltransferase